MTSGTWLRRGGEVVLDLPPCSCRPDVEDEMGRRLFNEKLLPVLRRTSPERRAALYERWAKVMQRKDGWESSPLPIPTSLGKAYAGPSQRTIMFTTTGDIYKGRLTDFGPTPTGYGPLDLSRQQRLDPLGPPLVPGRELGELPLRLAPYSDAGGHHVHQSAAYTPVAPAGQRQPASDRANPNHRRAVSIRQNVPGFTGAQHDRASAVQRATNQGMHGADVKVRTGGVTVRSSGVGALAPQASSTFEDLKAYYALRAAGRSPSDAFNAVQQSASQLAAAGAVPSRVPRR